MTLPTVHVTTSPRDYEQLYHRCLQMGKVRYAEPGYFRVNTQFAVLVVERDPNPPDLREVLYNLARLALEGKTDSIPAYINQLCWRYRREMPDMYERLKDVLPPVSVLRDKEQVPS